MALWGLAAVPPLGFHIDLNPGSGNAICVGRVALNGLALLHDHTDCRHRADIIAEDSLLLRCEFRMQRGHPIGDVGSRQCAQDGEALLIGGCGPSGPLGLLRAQPTGCQANVLDRLS